MRKIMNYLLELQRLQFDVRPRDAAAQAEVEKLRTQVPVAILAHYDRLVARNKKGVALARNGVCSACHLRITGGKLIGLSAGTDIQLCDNCGRYLYLPEEDLHCATDAKILTSLPAKRTAKNAAQHVP